MSYAEKRSIVDTWSPQIVPNFAVAADATRIALTLYSVGSAAPLFTCAP
jgi:hypothetical protein